MSEIINENVTELTINENAPETAPEENAPVIENVPAENTFQLGKVDSTCDEWKSWYDKQHGTDISCLVEGRNME